MSKLFSAFRLREVSFGNRVAVSPMSQYRARDGYINDWHLVHLGRFAMGGAGLVYTEATAVEADGRRTHGDLGLWKDEHIDGLARVAEFIEEQGAVPGIQITHAGRKASERRPWHGETPVDAEDTALRNEKPWPALAPSAIAYADGWPQPGAMTASQISGVIRSFGQAARRANQAGFKMIEVYAAHGFLAHQFLSPIANQRTDEWGGSASNRRRFSIEVAQAIREHWPAQYPLAFRLSATDWLDGGIEPDETVALSIALKEQGVDLIDCSSGGIGGKTRPRRMVIEQGFQVPFAQRIRHDADIATMAVGFLWDPKICEDIIATGKADMIALAREMLDDPNWVLHAAQQLDVDTEHALWPVEAGWWLNKRDRLLKKLGVR